MGYGYGPGYDHDMVKRQFKLCNYNLSSLITNYDDVVKR